MHTIVGILSEYKWRIDVSHSLERSQLIAIAVVDETWFHYRRRENCLTGSALDYGVTWSPRISVSSENDGYQRRRRAAITMAEMVRRKQRGTVRLYTHRRFSRCTLLLVSKSKIYMRENFFLDKTATTISIASLFTKFSSLKSFFLHFYYSIFNFTQN